jgi:CheY-like chemotaxis protein
MALILRLHDSRTPNRRKRTTVVSDTADLLRAIAGLSWVLLAFLALVALLRLVKGQKAPLSKLGIGPSGLTAEWFEAKLSEATSKPSDEQDGEQIVVGDAAKRSVIDRLQSHAALLRRARILWVDDHPENNTPITELLRRLGASVDTARSNADAFALLRTSRYDVIISDVGRDDEGPGSDLKGVELASNVAGDPGGSSRSLVGAGARASPSLYVLPESDPAFVSEVATPFGYRNIVTRGLDKAARAGLKTEGQPEVPLARSPAHGGQALLITEG